MSYLTPILIIIVDQLPEINITHLRKIVFCPHIPQPSKRDGLCGEKPEESACGTSWFYCNMIIFLAMVLLCFSDEFPTVGNSGNFLSEPQVRSPARHAWTLRIRPAYGLRLRACNRVRGWLGLSPLKLTAPPCG
ncbi:MAG: hypothetical protein LBH43_17035 [Treponema sp.]|nr:hypothetical protein [Treponema sp.]